MKSEILCVGKLPVPTFQQGLTIVQCFRDLAENRTNYTWHLKPTAPCTLSLTLSLSFSGRVGSQCVLVFVFVFAFVFAFFFVFAFVFAFFFVFFVFVFAFIFLWRMSWLWQVVVKSNFELDFKSLLSSALNFQLVGPFISTMGQRVNKLGKVHCKTLIHQTLKDIQEPNLKVDQNFKYTGCFL